MNIEQYETRDAWLQARRTGIGGSDVAAVLGISPWSDPLEVYAKKVGLMPEQETNEAMEWGLIHEPAIASEYARRSKRAIDAPTQYSLVRSETHPFLIASIDRFQIDAQRAKPGVLEIKTDGEGRPSEWLSEPPLYYRCQLQHQLLVTRLEWGTLACLFRGNALRWLDDEPHDKLHAAMLTKLTAFWERVEKQNPPEPTKLSADALRYLYPSQRPGETISLDGEACDILDDLHALDVLQDEYAAKAETLKNKLKAMLGDAEIGIAPDGRKVSWKKSKDVEAYLVPARPGARRLLIHKRA